MKVQKVHTTIKIRVKSSSRALRAMQSRAVIGAKHLLGKVFTARAGLGGYVAITSRNPKFDGWWIPPESYSILPSKKRKYNDNLMPRGNSSAGNRNFGLNSAGKGDKPRTLFDERWRQRYDEIWWGEEGRKLTGAVRVGNKLIKHYHACRQDI